MEPATLKITFPDGMSDEKKIEHINNLREVFRTFHTLTGEPFDEKQFDEAVSKISTHKNK